MDGFFNAEMPSFFRKELRKPLGFSLKLLFSIFNFSASLRLGVSTFLNLNESFKNRKETAFLACTAARVQKFLQLLNKF